MMKFLQTLLALTFMALLGGFFLGTLAIADTHSIAIAKLMIFDAVAMILNVIAINVIEKERA